MAHEEIIETATKKMVITNASITGGLLHAWKLYKDAHTAQVKAQKVLNDLVSLGRLERCGKRGGYYYRLHGCRSEFQDHAKTVTVAIAGYLSQYPDTVVYREHEIKIIGQRIDAILMLRRENQGKVILLEACLQETPAHHANKVEILKSWDALPQYLSRLFGYSVPHYQIVKFTGEPSHER